MSSQVFYPTDAILLGTRTSIVNFLCLWAWIVCSIRFVREGEGYFAYFVLVGVVVLLLKRKFFPKVLRPLDYKFAQFVGRLRSIKLENFYTVSLCVLLFFLAPYGFHIESQNVIDVAGLIVVYSLAFSVALLFFIRMILSSQIESIQHAQERNGLASGIEVEKIPLLESLVEALEAKNSLLEKRLIELEAENFRQQDKIDELTRRKVDPNNPHLISGELAREREITAEGMQLHKAQTKLKFHNTVPSIGQKVSTALAKLSILADPSKSPMQEVFVKYSKAIAEKSHSTNFHIERYNQSISLLSTETKLILSGDLNNLTQVLAAEIRKFCRDLIKKYHSDTGLTHSTHDEREIIIATCKEIRTRIEER